jgi:hypothetical protein
VSETASEWWWSWARSHWDPEAGLVRNPAGGYNQLGSLAGEHLVRESAWFAVGAFAHGDLDAATRALDTVLSRQYDRPGQPWHGTFPVFANDAEPGDDAIVWLSYDPNWRQFVGVAIARMVADHSHDMDDELRTRCEASVSRCVEGEPVDRISPSYTNPALMHAWLAWWVGTRFDHRRYAAIGRRLRDAVYDRFLRAHTVDEFNAPTYYGVDLVAAALWCSVEDATWRDAGTAILRALLDELQFLYHPRLRNLCGPYTRAYTLDLRSEVTLYGLWRLLARGERDALPGLGDVIPHGHDLFFAPLVEWALGHLPLPFPLDDEELPRRRTFTVDGRRVAEALLDRSFMLGAERGGRADLTWGQYVPGTAHWAEDGELRFLWVRGQPECPVDCSIQGDAVLRVEPAADATGPPRLGVGSTVLTPEGSNCLRVGRRVRVRGTDPLHVEQTWDGKPQIVAAEPRTTLDVEVIS